MLAALQRQQGDLNIEQTLMQIHALLDCRTMASLWGLATGCMREFGFPHMLYRGHRILCSSNEQMIVDTLALSEAPASLLQAVESHGLQLHLPMGSWMVRNIGAKSWAWLAENLEQISEREARALTLFRQHGLGSGIAISLADRVPRMRSVMLLMGRKGANQAEVDDLWQAHGMQIHLLAKLLHQRIATLSRDTMEPVLTTRQRQVLELTGLGLPCPAIAWRLRITEATVEKHLRLARAALGARNTAHAVLLAHGSHQIFVDIGEPCDRRTERAAHSAMQDLEPWAYINFEGCFASADPLIAE